MIAITGGIAEGKSTVLGMLHEFGYTTASADMIAREVFEAHRHEIATLLGFESADRDEVRQRVFEDPIARRALNAFLHPMIWSEMRRIDANFVEVPLLIETCIYPVFSRVWVVTCGQDQQFDRLSERLGSPDEARRLLGSQLPTRAKLPFADRIVRTNTDFESVKAFVKFAADADLL